jgi:hypothetical protein
MARRRRQSATRALDGVLGSWAKSNSQLDDELSTSTVVHHLFRIQNITAYRNVSYNQQVMGPIPVTRTFGPAVPWPCGPDEAGEPGWTVDSSSCLI